MKAVVFGGSGFVGSHVADALANAGYETIIFDKTASRWLRPDQKMVVGDILDEKKVADVVAGCDIVYNFAGIADIDDASERPLDSVKYNILGNSIIMEACRKAGNIKRFVFASSIYVYSKEGSFYRSTKQSCELLIENYFEVYDIPYTILRFGSLYGPRVDSRNAIHHFLMQALEDGKIVRHGDGEEIREYIHAYDAAKGSVEILSEEFKNQHVIITGYQQMKIKDLLNMIKEMFGGKIGIEYLPPTDHYHYEITPYTFMPRIAKRLTTKSYHDLGQGIYEMIHEYNKETNTLPIVDGLTVKKNGV